MYLRIPFGSFIQGTTIGAFRTKKITDAFVMHSLLHLENAVSSIPLVEYHSVEVQPLLRIHQEHLGLHCELALEICNEA